MQLPGSPSTRSLLVGSLAVATVATAGSLTYSLGLGLYPCRLCWYQRILMYPQVAVLAYAIVRGRTDVYLVLLPLSVLGAAIAAYHSYLQVAGSSTCSVFGCGTVQGRVLGLTIPNQSLLAFLLLVGGLVALRQVATREPASRDGAA